MPKLGIDVYTRDANRLIARLKRLKSTQAAGIVGTYPAYSQIWVDTSRSVEDMGDWLWRVKHGCVYAGVFEMTED